MWPPNESHLRCWRTNAILPRRDRAASFTRLSGGTSIPGGVPAQAPLGPTRQFAKRRNHRPVARRVPVASFKVERMLLMTGARGPSCVHECVLEVPLNLVDTLPRTLLTLASLHAFGEAPYHGTL